MALTSGHNAVTSAGTAQQLSLSTRLVRRVFIQADSGNSSGLISLGGTAATSVATAGSQQGRVLAASAAVELTSVRLSDIWVNATVSGNSVSYLVEQD